MLSVVPRTVDNDQKMDTETETLERHGVFSFFSLPLELQHLILFFAYSNGTSPTTLLTLSPRLYPHVLSLLYTHVAISSKKQLHRFLTTASASHKHAKEYTRRFTLNVAGVPGGNTQGGRESTLGSPRLGLSHGSRQLDNRLLLASKAVQSCPKLEHCDLRMFGVRHSSLLTSHDYIAEEASAFRSALSGLKHLQSFSWTTAKEDVASVGFSVAVVDLVFEPLIEGLEEAALDLDLDGRRIRRGKGDSLRYHHPLEKVTLHHCIFPSNQGKQFFQLFTKTHPDDCDFLLFPRVNLVCIRKATNVSPINVAFLALFWQLHLERSFSSIISRQPLDWNPILVMEDVYVGSIWGPKMADDLIQQEMEQLVNACLGKEEEKTTSSNAYIRALEESVEMSARLDQELSALVRSMQQWQRDHLIRKARSRVHIKHIEGSIASYQ